MFYTQSHEWIRVNGNIGTVGISEYAQHELGEIVYVELPKVGQVVESGKEVAVLESTKAAADVYAPVSGKVVAVNGDLKDNPGLVNQMPQESGWLFQVELANPKQLDHLFKEADYQKLISS